MLNAFLYNIIPLSTFCGVSKYLYINLSLSSFEEVRLKKKLAEKSPNSFITESISSSTSSTISVPFNSLITSVFISNFFISTSGQYLDALLSNSSDFTVVVRAPSLYCKAILLRQLIPASAFGKCTGTILSYLSAIILISIEVS